MFLSITLAEHSIFPNPTMRAEDRRYHEALFDQVGEGRTPFLNTAHVIEEWRQDLTQLLTFGRVTPEEYEELDARYAELARLYPLQPETKGYPTAAVAGLVLLVAGTINGCFQDTDNQCKVEIYDGEPQERIVATYPASF
jgi:hypothetical protein